MWRCPEVVGYALQFGAGRIVLPCRRRQGVGLAIWFLARLLTRSSFVATRTFLVLLPFIVGLVTQSWWYVLFGMALSLLYMSTHRPETDDHLLIKERWPNLWAFLTGPHRK